MGKSLIDQAFVQAARYVEKKGVLEAENDFQMARAGEATNLFVDSVEALLDRVEGKEKKIVTDDLNGWYRLSYSKCDHSASAGCVMRFKAHGSANPEYTGKVSIFLNPDLARAFQDSIVETDIDFETLHKATLGKERKLVDIGKGFTAVCNSEPLPHGYGMTYTFPVEYLDAVLPRVFAALIGEHSPESIPAVPAQSKSFSVAP